MPLRSVISRHLASVLAGGVCLSALFLAACSTEFSPDDARAEQPIQVNLGASGKHNQGFSPNPVTVIRRTRVTWTNADTTEHQIASYSGLFEGNVIRPGETYSFIFHDAASYSYRCLVPGHNETGVINVTP
jgi:plastocyanin